MSVKETNEEEVTQEVYKFVPKGFHDWRQHGPYLVCKSCDLQHSIYIGVNRQMVGRDGEGLPVLKKV